MQDKKLIVPAILCGGAGTRLWPYSRESMPKQFSRLVNDTYSTFQSALLRVSEPSVFDKSIVIAHNDARFIVAEQITEIGLEAKILLEPERRDSATAVAIAALYASKSDPQALVLILAADHVIEDTEGFRRAAVKAAEAAQHGLIMTFGIKPYKAASVYGYICQSEEAHCLAGVHMVSSFVEKPDSTTAAQLIADGALWNSGYFLFAADVLIEELRSHAPEILLAAQSALENATTDLDFVRLEANAYATAPKISFDYALMEKTARAGVMQGDFDWSDVGTWDAAWQAQNHDLNGNVVRGRAELLSTTDSLVHSDNDILTAVVGLDNVVVITTADAVLVSSKKDSARVKELVEILRKKEAPEVDSHRRMYRPWGWYQRIDLGERFQVKRIMVKPGGLLSLQKHYHRAEHWVVVKGTAEVTLDDSVSLIHENEAIYLPIGSMHRLSNPGKIPLELIEVQVGSYTGEDDIVRVADLYGRKDN
ncbi:mannose-1-phosphate guanylyltransferase/mannose-6-phosphate isomerase [Methylorubrum populi]|uniref:mannose-1-phosphate guanylyltransferase/mannose-6-phosphate isomerase n=1 Tax=Methylorubrum populi TaxID=223967 RepID=UPI003F65744F